MAKIGTATRDGLIVDLERLRTSGLASFDVTAVPNLVGLAVEAGFTTPEDVQVPHLQRLIGVALGLLDQDRLESSVACLFGLGPDMDLDSSLAARTLAAQKRSGLQVRAYNDRRKADIAKLADNLATVRDRAVRRRQRERSQRQTMPDEPPVIDVEPPQTVREAMNGLPAEEWLRRRQAKSGELWATLLGHLDTQRRALGDLSSKVCLFASGSFGRDEAMEYSDLDLFLVDDLPLDERVTDREKPRGRLNKFELGHALTIVDRVREAQGIQNFSKGGYYQEPQSFRDMISDAKEQREEPSRLTTALALLLANSKSFGTQEAYLELRERALSHYWRDQVGHRRPLRPTYLVNDLRRLWLTMLVDFERFYPKDPINDGRQLISGDKRKIAGLKLALPQKLGCYSPLLAMLNRSGGDGLLRGDADAVLAMTTSERLEELAGSANAAIAAAARSLIELYGQYLAFSWCDFDTMSERVSADDWSQTAQHFDKGSGLIADILWQFYAEVPDIARLVLV